ncbi:MAG: hypothetical protein KDA31_13980 [Phycisphaerales bacterium]|nr:hypothetical protein [Phycisphaerales bacterium]MCB9837615.1 hypothetical protein [Phycisphaera sp.]
MKGRFIALVALGAAVVFGSSGCTTVSRGLGKITANKYAKPRSGTVWTVAPPQLEPPAPDKKTVYISFRNISDASEINLTQELRQAATDQGWTVVNDPTNATYRLRASLRFFGEVEPESGGKDIANKMGWISGAATGVGTGVLVANATNSWGYGAAAGAGTGGLVGIGIANASTPREWAAIIDFVLEEHSDTPVEFEKFTDNSSNANTGAGVGNDRMSDAGGTRTGNSSNATITTTSDYFPHGVRLSAWANQMNMSEEEALPHIQDRISRVVTQMLPQ